MSANGETGLARPDQGPLERESRPRDADRKTRKPLAWWDRVKIFLLLVGAWTAMYWAGLANNRLLSSRDGATQALRSYWWILALAGLEVIRQIHYFISEHWARYHRFWTKRFFGAFSRKTGRMNDWNRFRVARAAKWLFLLFIFDLALAKAFGTSPATALFELPARLVVALPFIFQIAFAFFFIIFQFVGLFWFLSKGGSDLIFPEDLDVRFEDVKGQDSVLAKVKETVLFLEKPEAIEEKGGKVPKGILLWGPPGTGKTMMAKAVAGETSKPFLFVEPGAFIQMFMGVGVLKVKALFRKARKLSLKYGGMIMFFDEADSLGNRGMAVGGQGPFFRGGTSAAFDGQFECNGMAYMAPMTRQLLHRHGAPGTEEGPKRDGIIAGMGGMGGGGMGVLPALLSELDGMDKPRGFLNRKVRRWLGMKPKMPPKYRILTMLATNLPESLDPALLRPGRIDRMYKVGYPSKSGRIDTFRRYLAKVSNTINEEELDKISTITPYYGGAQIEDLVNGALINAIEEGRDTVTWKDLVKAKQLKDLGPPEDVEYIERERHAVAVHEACHAVAAYRVRHHLMIDIATIEKGGTYLGMVASIPPEDQFTRWRSEYEADIMVGLASLAGERLFFESDSSSGVSGDLAAATYIASYMEGYWGMGSTVTSHGVTQEIGIGGGGKPGGEGKRKERELLEGSLGYRVEQKLGDLLKRTEDLLKENRESILALAHALEANKTLTGDDVEAIIDGKAGPLLDGRPYHSADFIESLERYHSAALAAHKQHAKVMADLPVPSPIPAYVGGYGNGEVAGRELPPVPVPPGESRGGNGSLPPRPDVG
jgi:cell division protease FtsH